MESCTVTFSETGDLSPLIVSAFNSQSVHDFVARTNVPHPLPITSRAWSAVMSSLDKTLDLLALARTDGGKSKGIVEALEVYQLFLYRIAEFVETVEKQTRSALECDKAYKVPRDLDRLLSEQCNAIKHEHMHLNWVSANDHFFRVHGYQMRHHVGIAEAVAKRFHAKRPSFSFNLEIRRLLAGLYLLGDDAGHAVMKVHGAPEPLANKMPAVLQRVIEMPALIYPKEQRQQFPLIAKDDTELRIASSGGPHMTIGIGGSVQILAVSVGDGFTRTFDRTDV